jgi:hypothetical protein
MTQHSLFPAYLKIGYHSAFGVHTMTIPTRAWNSVGITGDVGNFINWEDVPVDGEEMIDDLIAALAAGFEDTTIFDSATVYTFESEDSPPRPQGGKALAVAGSEAIPGTTKAVQNQLTMFDTSFNTFKLVALDAASYDVWNKRGPLALHTWETAVVAILTDTANGWSSRANLRPNIVRSAISKMNDELRKQYGMS